jgi:hypothetical protein
MPIWKNKQQKISKVDRFIDKSIKNQMTNCLKLYENHLVDDRSELIGTLDKAFVYLENANKSKRICYV